jgi:hypothetical protein
MSDSHFIIYQTDDGKTQIEALLENENVWLTQVQMAELFQKGRSTITEHIKNLFDEEELEEHSVSRKYRLTASDGKSYLTTFYNLDVVISVGYRVKSFQGTKFRQWATARLKEFIIKGFVLNDELLKNIGKGNYFDELLSRIRDIRSSEKVFWRKVLDIYATSIDYDPKQEITILFFQTVQNKMHWAAHGNTAAEIIFNRIDANKPNLGLTSFKGEKPTKQETEIAKNYLDEKEINILNRTVSAFIELAELQALNLKPMYMRDWIDRLDDFLRMTGSDVLQTSGTISHKKAIRKAELEYGKFKEKNKDLLTKAETDFIKHIDLVSKKIENKKQ